MTGSVMRHTAMDYRRRVCLAMNFISRNLDQELSLKEIAETASFSRFHFHRIFTAVVGETVSEFTRRLRLEQAANRLLANDDAITGIAMDCGFSSSQNFAKAFKCHFGMTPSAYRHSKLGNIKSKGENALSLRISYDTDNEFRRLSKSRARKNIKPEIREMPEYHVAYVRKLGAYGNEPYAPAFRELRQWAEPLGYLTSGTWLGVYWDNPEVTAPEKRRSDACLSVPKGTAPRRQIGLQTINGGPYVVCPCKIKADEFQAMWEAVFAWLILRGYECADLPCYELYHNNPEDPPHGKWLFDICIPLKRK